MDKKMEIIDRAKYLYYSNACNKDIGLCVNTALAEAGGVSNVVPQDELRGIYSAFDIDEKTYEVNFADQLTRETYKEIAYEAMQNERNT